MYIDNKENNMKTEAISMVLDLNNVILEKWNYAINQIVKRKFYQSQDADVWKEQVTSAIYNLFYSIRISFCDDTADTDTQTKQKNVNKRLKEVEQIFTKGKESEVIDLFNEIDAWLYRKGVTKFDTRSIYDKQIAERANRARGL